jgi:hypothetical protein
MRLLSLFILACSLAPADTSVYRKAAHDAATNLDVQQSLPDDSTLTDAPKSHGSEFPGPDAESTGNAPSLSAVWDQLKWVALGLVVAGLLAFLASQIAESRRIAPPVPASAMCQPAAARPPTAEQLLTEADAFAAQGRYRDAMHSVVLAAMAHVARRFRDGAPESATSREMLGAADLEPSESAALRDLVTRTDRAWFGEYPSDADDYAAARRCFETFLGFQAILSGEQLA